MEPPEQVELLENNKARVNTFKSQEPIVDIKDYKILSFWDKIEALFQRKVDLLTDDTIKNPYLKSNINRTKKLIYDGEGEKDVSRRGIV